MSDIFEGIPRNKFQTITADPPWSFDARSDKGDGRSAKRHYKVMGLDAIKAMPVADLAAKDCVLLMWVTDTHLAQSLDVIKAWGFTYKTVGFYWAKTNKSYEETSERSGGREVEERDMFMGMGFWARSNPEQCLLATRGNPKRISAAVRKLIVAPRREHSRKPDETFVRVEKLVDGPYLELFAREAREGWTSWGNEIDKFDRPRRDPFGDAPKRRAF